jgi:hypothetical protein
MEVGLKLLGILLGVLARTLVLYLRKLKQGKVKNSGMDTRFRPCLRLP